MANGGAGQQGDKGGIGCGHRGSVSGEQAYRSDKILDEFVAVTGYTGSTLRPKTGHEKLSRRQSGRRYGAEVREALIAVWEASDRLCSKRLQPIIPALFRGNGCPAAGADRLPVNRSKIRNAGTGVDPDVEFDRCLLLHG